MDAISTLNLKELLREGTGPCVSLYMPTHPVGADGQQDLVRWKNQLREAEDRLIKMGMAKAEAGRMLEAPVELAGDTLFWKGRRQGLAAFVAPGVFRSFRLTQPFAPLTVVGRAFHVRPLLPLVARELDFYLLTLSQKDVRLFATSGGELKEQKLPAFPLEMKATLNYTSVDRGEQAHTAMRGRTGKQAAVFHGQGGQVDTRKTDVTQFFHVVDEAVAEALAARPAPLMLAGVEYLLPLYRDVSRVDSLVEQELPGNCDYLTVHELYERARTAIAPLARQSIDAAAARLRERIGSPKASTDVVQIVPAARGGRVDTLFADERANVWGVYDPATDKAELHATRQPQDDELIDLAVADTLASGGTVYVLEKDELPGGQPLAALLRFA